MSFWQASGLQEERAIYFFFNCYMLVLSNRIRRKNTDVLMHKACYPIWILNSDSKQTTVDSFNLQKQTFEKKSL